MKKKGEQKTIKKYFSHFWHSEDGKVSLLRDVLVAFLFVIIILLALWTYTGQWFGAPMVAIESSSMEHPDESSYGRLGTIDAGDMVFLVKVNTKDDVIPFAESNDINYGKPGDVVVYKPDGIEEGDQIIHRAMCWIEVEIVGNITYYTIKEYDIIKQPSTEPLYIPDLGIKNRYNNDPVFFDGLTHKNNHYQKFTHSGFITKGDNKDTNKECDQIGQISRGLIKVEWISGKASCELPWIGIINLFFNDLMEGVLFTPQGTLKYVSQSSFDCLFILLELLVLIPVGLDIYSYYKTKKKQLLDSAHHIYEKQKNDLDSMVLYYWIGLILLFLVSHYLIQSLIADIIHLIIIVIIHLIFLKIFEIQIVILKIKNISKWIFITAFTGPIGVSIFYYLYQSGKKL